MSLVSIFVQLIGVVAILSLVYKLWLFVSFHFLPFGNSLKKYQRQPARAWALVTGASAGIGLGHAQELVARGFGVILLGHKEWELDEAIAKIEAEVPGAACKKIVLDVIKADYGAVEAALKSVMNDPITILINNVAVQTSKPLFSHFESYRPTDIIASIGANNLFLCNITHILYPVLKRNGPSLIVNLSSGAHTIGLPFMTVYCGTKAFVDSFSMSLSRETGLLKHAIDLVAILPGDVRSQGNVHGASPHSPDGRQYARMILDRVERAVERGIRSYSPYWKHDIEGMLARNMPEKLVSAGILENMLNRRSIEEKAM